MNVLSKCLLGTALLVLASGCASTRYDWNNYDSLLYKHYRNPANVEEFTEKLQKAVLAAEQAQRVPPGLYAEYGYLLYERGSYQLAIDYFRKEKQLWPESRVLMEKMINNASKMLDRTNPSLGSNR
jgi:hypothetical protein